MDRTATQKISQQAALAFEWTDTSRARKAWLSAARLSMVFSNKADVPNRSRDIMRLAHPKTLDSIGMFWNG